MWKLKACPRCGGDIFPDWEKHVSYEHCLQCGYSRIVQQSTLESKKQTVEKGKEPIRL